MLVDWDPILKPNPYLVALGQAFVRRLARDTRILLLLPEDLGIPGQKKPNCPGCPKCNGHIWKFKTETVAVLYAMFCKCLKLPYGCIHATSSYPSLADL